MEKETLEVMKKEQTIEQASEYYAHNYFDMHETNNYKALKEGFINGAKWQAERMYSEEEVKQLINQYKEYFSIYRNTQILNAEIEEWFEQVKKK